MERKDVFWDAFRVVTKDVLSVKDVLTAVMKVWGKIDMKPYLCGIPTYAIMASIGLFVMMLTLYFRCKELSFKEFLLLMLFMVIGVGMGSKFLFVLTKLPVIVDQFSVVKTMNIIIESGFVFYGGLFGAIGGLYIFAKIFKKNVKGLLDLVSIGFAVFHVFGRIGCFMAGCCYGREAGWGFPMSHSPGILRVPVQLIESICLIGIIIIILIVEKRMRLYEYSFYIYIGLYASCRFAIEFFRGDAIRGIWWCFSTSQWISLFILLMFVLHGIKHIVVKACKIIGNTKGGGECH